MLAQHRTGIADAVEDARPALVEASEDVDDRPASDLGPPLRCRDQRDERAGQDDLGHAGQAGRTAASTDQTAGRSSTIRLQEAPSSDEAKTEPVDVPK